jgi:hypothetical protein
MTAVVDRKEITFCKQLRNRTSANFAICPAVQKLMFPQD